MSLLGYDFLQGIFHFRVGARFTPASPGNASLEVGCFGVYTMGETIDIDALSPLPSSISKPGITWGPPQLQGLASTTTNTNSPRHISAFLVQPATVRRERKLAWVRQRNGARLSGKAGSLGGEEAWNHCVWNLCVELGTRIWARWRGWINGVTWTHRASLQVV